MGARTVHSTRQISSKYHRKTDAMGFGGSSSSAEYQGNFLTVG
jgi:hypothetical protein